MKIVLINNYLENYRIDSNKGGEAVLVSTIQILRKLIPGAEIVSFVQCKATLAKELNIRVIENKVSAIKFFSINKSISLTINLLRCYWFHQTNKQPKNIPYYISNNSKLREYATADIIIHLGMDLYSSTFGTWAVLEHSKDLLCGLLLGRPVVMWAESIGPFSNKIAKSIAKNILNKVSLILVRERITLDILNNIGVNNANIFLTADPAFLLIPSPQSRIDEIISIEHIFKNELLVGITPSQTFLPAILKTQKGLKIKYIKVMRKFASFLLNVLPETSFRQILKIAQRSIFFSPVNTEYIKFERTIAGVSNYLIEKYNAKIILIPHDTISNGLFNDRIMADEIYQMVKNQNNIRVIKNEYKAEEIKGIIGRCDLFIGTKMHANIAALSQGRPVIGLSYDYKFKGIMALFGQEKYVCDDLLFSDIIQKVDDAMTNKAIISTELMLKCEEVLKNALLNGELTKKLLDKNLVQ